MFKKGDLTVYPAHGVGIIETIESQEISGFRQDRTCPLSAESFPNLLEVFFQAQDPGSIFLNSLSDSSSFIPLFNT